MGLTLRRTRADDPERDTELSQTIDIGALHALLHAHGEADLAAALLLRLTPEGARDLAALLARFRRGHSKPGLFRSYKRLLDADEARRVDLAVAFLRGAGHAGCRVYPDPQTDDDDTPVEAARPRPLYPLLSDGKDERDPEGDVEDEDTEASGDPSRAHPPRSIMPPWLPRPHGSSWDR